MNSIKKLSKEDILKIETLTNKFIDNTLANESPFKMCFNICFPLHLHLKNNCIENSIRAGKCESIQHFWLHLEDIDQTIIDPTIRQFSFGENKPSIYIGKKTKDYNEDTIPITDWFDKTYDGWLTTFRLPECYSSGETKVDFNLSLKIHLTASNIINKDIEKMKIDISKSILLGKYLSGINEIIEISNRKCFSQYLTKNNE